MADLRTELCGIELCNPIVLASGPLSYDSDGMIRAHRAGAGAVVTKTICPEATHNPIPHIAQLSSGLLNGEGWSDLPAEVWIDREIPRAVAAGVPVIGSLGLGVANVVALAELIAEAGAVALEVVSYDAGEMAAMIAEAAQRVRIPIFAKLSANWGADVPRVAASCLDAGASGLTAIDSVGPGLRFDVARRVPLVGSGYGWISGPAILPIALRVVASIALERSVPIVGTGGVRTADDAIEMLLAGASAVGLCSHLLAAGLGALPRLLERLSARIEELGVSSAQELVGTGLPALTQALKQPTRARGEPGSIRLAWHGEACNDCGLCVGICPYSAHRTPGDVDLDACRLCGLCVTSCPTGALVLRPGEASAARGEEGGEHGDA